MTEPNTGKKTEPSTRDLERKAARAQVISARLAAAGLVLSSLISLWAVKIASDAHDIANATLTLEREYKERSMQPHLTATWSEFDYSYTLKNSGVGPAVIKWFVLQSNVPPDTQCIDSRVSATVEEQESFHNNHYAVSFGDQIAGTTNTLLSLVPGTIIAAGESIVIHASPEIRKLYTTDRHDEFKEYWKKLRRTWGSRIEYTSISGLKTFTFSPENPAKCAVKG